MKSGLLFFQLLAVPTAISAERFFLRSSGGKETRELTKGTCPYGQGSTKYSYTTEIKISSKRLCTDAEKEKMGGLLNDETKKAFAEEDQVKTSHNTVCEKPVDSQQPLSPFATFGGPNRRRDLAVKENTDADYQEDHRELQWGDFIWNGT